MRRPSLALLLLLSTLLLTSCNYARKKALTTLSGADFSVDEDRTSATALGGGGGGGGDRDRELYTKRGTPAKLAAPPAMAALRINGQRDASMDVLVELNSVVEAADNRKVVRTAAMDLVVDDPQQAVQRIAELAQQAGGYVESSTVSGSQPKAQSAEMVVRVPEARLDAVRDGVKKLAARVEKDNSEAKDVTRDYVDTEARLRSLKAQEQEYLALMKRATKVSDMTDIQEKLGDVREQIETQQGEFNYLSKQIDMSTLTLEIQPRAEAQVGGIYWHPWLTIKRSFRDMAAGLIDFADAVIGILFYLPVIALWLVVAVFGAKAAWRLVVWMWRRMPAVRPFWRKTAPAPSAGD